MPRSLPPAPARHVAVLGLVWLGLLSACTEECRTDIDCRGDGGLQQCVEGMCQALSADLGPSCSVSDDCTPDVGVQECIGGSCVFVPSCQPISGDFDAILKCGATQTTEDATATANGCAVQFTLDDQDPVVTIDIPSVGLVTDGPSSFTPTSTCTSGTWASVTTMAALEGCTVNGSACDIFLIAKARRDVCSPAADTCSDAAVCSPLDDYPPAGICQ